jgi:hypothetical protein
MALGLARIFGLELPWNFDRPFRSASPTEFWRRWHVTLSTWMRDYLYIWLNARYAVPDTDPSAYHLAEYLLSRSAFTTGLKLVRQAHYILSDRWRKTEVDSRCVIGRIYPSINWRLDGAPHAFANVWTRPPDAFISLSG